MIDPIVFQVAREKLKSNDYEQTPTRCILSDDLIKQMIGMLYNTINNKKINEQVINFCNSMQNNTEFKVLYDAAVAFNYRKIIKLFMRNFSGPQVSDYCTGTTINH